MKSPALNARKRPKLLESVNNKRDVLFRDGRRNTLLNCHPDGKYTEIVLNDAVRLCTTHLFVLIPDLAVGFLSLIRRANSC